MPSLRLPTRRFLDLKPEIAARARGPIGRGRRMEAVRLIRDATGCSLGWADLRVGHPDGPRERRDSGDFQLP